MTELVHATAVAVGGRAVLLTGPSGAGKSDLALRLIDRGAVLISDDQVELRTDGTDLLAAPPQSIAGRMEVRGVGIVAMQHRPSVPVALIVELATEPERMPEPCTRLIAGHAIPLVAVTPFEPSAPIKVELALRTFGLPA
jgi:serine kinase of HPr protein (carbohydrate metabolism regulator)